MDMAKHLEHYVETSSGRHIHLHVLALVGICDHCTRVKVGGSVQSSESRILGILFGVQNGLQVSITDAFELQYDIINSEVRVSAGYVNEKKKLHAEVHPDTEIMGWYSVDDSVLSGDLEIHRVMREWNENPIFLLMKPSGAANGTKDLPLSLHESELRVINEVPDWMFVTVPFQLDTAEAERISVEHVVKATPTEGESSVDLHVEAIKISLQALISRLQAILRFLDKIRHGTLSPDHRLLRQISSLCQQLPVAAGGDCQQALVHEYRDSLVITYLAAVSKLTCLSNEMTDKYHLTFGDKGRGRH